MSQNLPTTGTVSDLDSMNRIDEVEARILAFGGDQAKPKDGLDWAPVKHHFTPGLYAREILMPAQSIITSKIHLTRHPYVVSQGRCWVYMGGEGEGAWQVIQAPHFGITEPGTRRILVILEDTVWTTFHATDLTDVEEIENTILLDYQNPKLGEGATQ